MLGKAAGTSRWFHLFVALCTTLSLANCSLVCSMLTHVLRVVCWTDQLLFLTSPSCSGGQREYGCERASLVLLWPLGRDPAKAPLSRDRHSCSLAATAALAVPRGQWARLDSDTLVLIDRSACLVEPCACDWRITRSSRSAHGCLPEPHRGCFSFCRFRPVLQFWHLFVSCLRDLGLLLDDRLQSAPCPLCS